MAQIHTFLQVRYSFALVRSLSFSLFLSLCNDHSFANECLRVFFLALFFYCDCCDCLLFGLFSTFIVLFLSFEFCDFIRQIQSDIHHTHQNKLNKVYSCRNNKYFILSLFYFICCCFFIIKFLYRSFVKKFKLPFGFGVYICVLFVLFVFGAICTVDGNLKIRFTKLENTVN